MLTRMVLIPCESYTTNSNEIYRMDRNGREHLLIGMVLIPYGFHGSS